MTEEQQTIPDTQPSYRIEVGRNRKASYKPRYHLACNREDAFNKFNHTELLPGEKKRLVDADGALIVKYQAPEGR